MLELEAAVLGSMLGKSDCYIRRSEMQRRKTLFLCFKERSISFIPQFGNPMKSTYGFGVEWLGQRIEQQRSMGKASIDPGWALSLIASIEFCAIMEIFLNLNCIAERL